MLLATLVAVVAIVLGVRADAAPVRTSPPASAGSAL
jgi:hypothetical protein